MNVTVVCVGKLKEAYWRDGISEYSKRLQKYMKLDIIELADEKAPERMSEAQELEVKRKEGQRILKSIKENSFVVVLAIEGKELSSEGLAEWITQKEISGISHITFVIGGSLGVSAEVMKRGDFYLSFSPMTFPHQMMRLILLEQIYRSMKIQKKEPYHK